MSGRTAKAARAATGLPYRHPQKVGTPVLERAFFQENVIDPRPGFNPLPRRRVIGQRIRKAFDLGWLPKDNKAAAEVTL